MNDYAIVSAPGRFGERGSVHVYTYSDSEAEWSTLQTLTSELWSLGESSQVDAVEMEWKRPKFVFC